jgi:hypothetical protein
MAQADAACAQARRFTIATQETLILAVTQMLGGVCIAGMTTEPHPVTGLRWVRPVREHDHVLLGDISTVGGTVLRPFDVVEFNLLRARPSPPHVEDWITDFVHQRPRILRRLEGDRRASFLRRHMDRAPDEVLESQSRSLCLVKPAWIRGAFHLDAYSGKLDARLAFGLGQHSYLGSKAQGGLAVTDVKWRAVGRSWLGEEGGSIEFGPDEMRARLGIHGTYVVLGLTRSYQGSSWSIVVGVHTLPDYEASVEYDNL